eukprot:TRINITY_DN13806_c0_g2_i1.p1 TRINITY_DN13806_c0_g2~~TRINITY_DN13806_c0_g2_i1.p1  ORF type:complete len:157 (+),score=44.59 TRINITY_DN13806_c0_g2_i1:450-920(+)
MIGAAAAGLGYGAYKAAPYVSKTAMQKWMQWRGVPMGAAATEEMKDHLLSMESTDNLDDEKLKEFIETYENEEEKKAGVNELIEKLKAVIKNSEAKTGSKAIDCNDQKFKAVVLSNRLADEMLTSLNFEKEESSYNYKVADTSKLKSAIKYFSKHI